MSNIEGSATRARPPYITASFLFLIGLALLVGGAKLVLVHGSPYFVIAGSVILVSAALYWKGNRWGERIYALVLLGTLLWSVTEAWGNPWALVARLFAPAVLGVLISLPLVRRGLAGTKPTMWQSGALHGALVVLVVLAVNFFQASTNPEKLAAAAVAQPFAAADSDWTHFGGTLRGAHFAPLTQITPDNVANLQVAWTYRSGDVSQKNFSEATPLKVNDLLYTCAPRGLVIAIDARTGQERWRFDPKADISKQPVLNCRGVSYHKQAGVTGACAERIFATSVDGRFHALDALDGKPCEGFGQGGAVSLFDGLGEVTSAIYFNTSPPTIAGGVAVIGALVRDSLSSDMPSGVVRAYDVVTGELRWAWDMGAPERIGAPPPGETYTRSTPNAWIVFAADEALGLVYVPTGAPSSADLFGGLRRPFDDQYGSSLVALSLADGRPNWSFQTTRHDLWDFDNPAQPVLADIPAADGTTTPVVIQATKRGEIFVLDRRDGKPVIPVKEKDVPQGAVEGDWTSKTQPFSELSFAPPVLRESDMWGLTPIDAMICRIQFRQARYEGEFTPPGLTPTIFYPGSLGGIDWGGVTVDEDRHVLIANTNDVPWMAQFTPRELDKAPYMPQAGTPYTIRRHWAFMGPLTVPCGQPPWGQLAAVDLATNKILWRHPVGTARDSGPLKMKLPIPLPIGAMNFGGTLSTRGGLVFMGATFDNYIRAFDVRNGRELWRARLPAGGQAMPMTYMAGGKQYVVITAGGHGRIGTTVGDYTIAYTLPDAK